MAGRGRGHRCAARRRRRHPMLRPTRSPRARDAGPPPPATRSRCPALHAAAEQCFAAALEALARLDVDAETVAATAAFHDRYVARGRCPADDRLRRTTPGGARLHRRLTVGPTKPQIVDALDDAAPAHARRSSIRSRPPTRLRQVSPLMSPLVLGPRAHRALRGALAGPRARAAPSPPIRAFDDIYDAFKHPRRERVSLPILDPAGARAVRRRCAQAQRSTCSTASTLDPGDPLLADGFVYGMVVQHEHQHDETLLATLQLDGRLRASRRRRRRAAAADVDDPDATAISPPDVLVDGGTFTMGTSTEPWAYDNERPAHDVDGRAVPHRHHARHQPRLPRVRRSRRLRRRAPLGPTPAGPGVRRPRWSRRSSGSREGDGTWSRRRFGRREDLPLDEPVQHVCWYEADAFARWSRRPPAHRARVGDRRRGRVARRTPTCGTTATAPLRARPRSAPAAAGAASQWGVHQLFGDVWEWTASDFHGYPGSRRSRTASTRRCSSGRDYKVLRGGSWATHPARDAHRRSATGTTRSAGRSSPGSAARATPDQTDDPCAAISPTSVPPIALGTAAVRRARTRCATRRARRGTRRSGA